VLYADAVSTLPAQLHDWRLPAPKSFKTSACRLEVKVFFYHILKVFDYGVIDKRSYFAAEFIKGKPINQYFNGYSPEFINAMLQIIDVLTQFHNRGYFHGDLKPGHILYMPEKKQTILIDFGFASLKEEWQTPRGTYFYMAPEVIKGIGIDQRSDLYSLGVIIYEILSNQRASKTQIKQSTRFDTEAIIPLHSINPENPLEISNIVSRLLAIEPALRPYAGEVYETFIKFSNERRLRKTMFKMSFPTLPFIPTDNNIFNSLLDLEKIRGKAFIIIGDKGSGKTRLLNELRYRYLLTGNEVLMISDKTKRFFEKICDYVRYNLKEVAHKDKYTIFEEISKYSNETKVLDVGVSAQDNPSSNFFEQLYPFKENLTAVGLGDFFELEKIYYGIKYIKADGRNLPFKENEFDWVFSHAVVEHVGVKENQLLFLKELYRVSKVGIFITTPNRLHPLEFHTGLLFFHYLPKYIHLKIYGLLGFKFYSTEENLNLLFYSQLKKLAESIAPTSKINIIQVPWLFFPANNILIIYK
ncbi:MAG: protein kinase, partial [Candidatus Pacearchaeota archaeon]